MTIVSTTAKAPNSTETTIRSAPKKRSESAAPTKYSFDEPVPVPNSQMKTDKLAYPRNKSAGAAAYGPKR